MKITQLAALAALSLLAMSNSCKKENDPAPCPSARLVNTAQVTGLNAPIAEPIPTVGQSHQYVINSTEEYRAVFAGKVPPVDFATYTLLAGKTRLGTCGQVQAQQVTQTCTGYTYTVKLVAGEKTTATNLTYYVLVPKLPAAAKVEFDVQQPQALQAQR